MKRVGQKILVLLIALPVVIYVIFETKNIGYFLTNQREPARYILPDGYQGWVAILYNDHCDAALKENGYDVYVIPDKGWICTSTQRERGFSQDIIIYKSSPKKNLLKHPGTKMNFIWHDHKRQLKTDETAFLFYVGYELTKKQQEKIFAELEDMLAKIESELLSAKYERN